MARWLIRAVIGVAMATLLLLGGGYFWLHTSLPKEDREIALAGLSAPVEIFRDENGIPHIFAQTEDDAAFALGYVHAEDRLWQMETMRRMGSGRLSELFGASLLDLDRHMRTLGLHRLAKEQSRRASEPVMRLLKSYAAGVNGWLGARKGALPPEFVVLGFEPEPWEVADSMLWGPLMAWRLGTNRHDELLRARLSDRLSPRQIAELWPSLGNHFDAALASQIKVNRQASAQGILAGEDPMSPRAGASNIWAVGGTKTASGKPLLANDPHLHFSAPGTWYLARVVTPSLTLAGATSAGVPFVILGHNDRVAWGMTTANADVEDYYIEAVDPTDASRYRVPGGRWELFETQREVIAVRGGEASDIVVRKTRHGPVISDAMAGAVPLGRGADEAIPGAPVLAFAASYLREDARPAEAIFALNRARNWEEFVGALARYDITPQNIFYADIDDNIGFVMPGRVPIRRSGRGLMPTAGWTGDTDWIGFVPYDRLPRSLNPPDGLLINANNDMLPQDYAWFISADWEEPFRAKRIAEILQILATEAPISADAMSEMQKDNVSLMAQQLLPKMLAHLPKGSSLPEPARGLVEWSGEMDRHRPEPLLFEAWLRELNKAVYADELGDAFPSYWSHRPLFIEFVLENGTAWCDNVTTPVEETCPEVVAQSLDAAVRMLEKAIGPAQTWRWGHAHNARLDHDFFNRLPLASRLASRRIEADGGAYTINRVANFLGSSDQPFAGVHGSGYRAVYDLADLAASRFMIVPGQSGNPLSRTYDDLLTTWRDGGWIQMESDRDEMRRNAKGRVLLRSMESLP